MSERLEAPDEAPVENRLGDEAADDGVDADGVGDATRRSRRAPVVSSDGVAHTGMLNDLLIPGLTDAMMGLRAGGAMSLFHRAHTLDLGDLASDRRRTTNGARLAEELLAALSLLAWLGDGLDTRVADCAAGCFATFAVGDMWATLGMSGGRALTSFPAASLCAGLLQ